MTVDCLNLFKVCLQIFIDQTCRYLANLVTNYLACAALPVHALAAPAWLQGLVLNKKSLFSNLLHSITHCLASVTFPHY